MALKQDERALLQLVCERGQSYTDLAELLAISEDEVREGRGSGVIAPLQILTVDQAVARIREISDGIPVEHLYLWGSIGGMPEALVERQMELLVDGVQPALNR